MYETISKPLPVIVAPAAITSGTTGAITRFFGNVATAPDGTLLGVDIWHRNGFGRQSEAEVCVGFAAQSKEFYATLNQFDNESRVIFNFVARNVQASREMSNAFFDVLGWDTSVIGRAGGKEIPELYTIVSRDFTFAYTYERTQPFSKVAGTVHATLLLHDRQTATTAPELLSSLNACLKELTVIHDVLKQVRFEVPTLSDILAAR